MMSARSGPAAPPAPVAPQGTYLQMHRLGLRKGVVHGPRRPLNKSFDGNTESPLPFGLVSMASRNCLSQFIRMPLGQPLVDFGGTKPEIWLKEGDILGALYSTQKVALTLGPCQGRRGSHTSQAVWIIAREAAYDDGKSQGGP